MKSNRPLKPKYVIVIDGETEFWYLQMLKRNERTIKVDIKPEIPQKKKLSEQYKRVRELSCDYDRVFWIVDLDVILANSTISDKKECILDDFLRYQTDFENNYTNILVIINQPCLEFWFLLHFEYTTQLFSNCGEAERKLRKYITGYVKSEKFFTKQDNDIYLRLKSKLSDAISNSKKIGPFKKESPNRGLTEMYKLFETILQQPISN